MIPIIVDETDINVKCSYKMCRIKKTCSHKQRKNSDFDFTSESYLRVRIQLGVINVQFVILEWFLRFVYCK